GEIARDQSHHGRARDVDDEGAPGKSGAHAAGAGDVDQMAQTRAKPATDKDQQIAHRSMFHVSEVTRQTACAAGKRAAQGSKVSNERRQWDAAALWSSLGCHSGFDAYASPRNDGAQTLPNSSSTYSQLIR